MIFGVGNLVALICIVISIVFAIVTNQATNALWTAPTLRPPKAGQRLT
jgi:hypothetical protein